MDEFEHFVFPMSAAQKQLWFLDQLQPEDAFYNLSGIVHLEGPLDVDALKWGLTELVRRHESLRTTFTLVDEQPSQVIAPERAVTLRQVDLRELNSSARHEALERLIASETREGFDLSQGPLLRTTLVRLDPHAHALLVTMHHIISDGWSLAVFSQELTALYEAATTHASPALPELAIQYADFSCWQNEQLDSGALASRLEYWRGQIADAPALLELPLDLPRPPVQTFQGRSVTRLLEGPLVDQLEALGRANGHATLFMVLLAAFGTLLHRYSGQECVVIGSPVAGRSRPETEPLIGLFVNTLPLRLDFAGRPTFRELLASVRDTVLSALAHQEVPFAAMVDALQPVRNPSHNPLFQVLFAFQNTPPVTRELRGLRVALEERSTSARFDLTLEIGHRASGLQVRWEYNTALFEETTACRMAEHYVRLLHALCDAAPQTLLEDVRMLSGAERERLLRTWNATHKARPGPHLLHALFEAQAALRPEHVAVVEDKVSLTYGELNARANQVAHFLRARGLGPEQVVGLHSPKTWRGLVGLLGILKAGAAWLPLEPTVPAERRAFMLQDARCQWVLCAGDAPVLDGVSCLSLEREWPCILQESERDPEVPLSEEHLAYVIYTSGTTGHPKGVGVIHQGIHNTALAQIEAFDVTGDSRVLQFASWGFDASVSELAMALGSGAALHLLGGTDVTTLGLELLDVLERRSITHVTLPPSLLSVLPPRELPALRCLIVAGERCPAELVTRWGEGRAFFNAYGPTEASVCATLTRHALTRGHVSIGRPLDNVMLYVLDAHMHPVPPGVRGELYIGGLGLARGYVGQPALTAERFVPHPHAQRPGERLYRTGDLARFLPEGDLEFLGRGDGQIKLRGYRVELGEVEAVLRGTPGVQEAAVVEVEGRLVAFIIPERGQRVTDASLRVSLNEHLPVYMRPSGLHFLEEALPLTASGKVARDKLRALAVTLAEAPRQELVGARDAVEERLLRVFRTVLGRDEVGIRDNFFDLGGDSIRGIQVSTEAQRQGLLVTPRQLLQYQTIEQLAPHVREHQGRGPASARAEGTSPPTPIQRWFLEEASPGLHHFNQSLVLEVSAVLTPEILAGALTRLARHHEVLGSHFSASGARWLQSYAQSDTALAFETKDLSVLSPRDEDEAIAHAVQTAQASLNIERGPLFRAVLVRRGSGRAPLLLLVAHHLVVDAVSWRILTEDLDTVARQLQRGEPVSLPLRTATFQQWAESLEHSQETAEVREELAYWERLARKAQPPRFPVERPGGENTYGSARVVTASLEAEETLWLLHEAPKTHHATVQEILLTALAETVASWTRTSQVLLELESQGREGAEAGLDVSRTVGWFTALHPLLLQVDRDRPELLLSSTKEQLRGIPASGLNYLSLCHQVRGLASLVPELGFNYLGQTAAEGPREASLLHLAERQYNDLDVDPRRPRAHLWDVGVSLQSGRLLIEWTYSPCFHGEETISGLVRSFLEAVRKWSHEGLQPTAANWTPSDFPRARLSQRSLDAFIRGLTQS